MTPAEKRKQKLEESIAQTRAELKEAHRFTPQKALEAGALGNKRGQEAEDPLESGFTHDDVMKGQYKGNKPIPEGAERRKELTFNTYISQIEEPRSFLNLLPETMREAVLSLPEELINQEEDTLLPILVNKYQYTPTAAAEALRSNFWMEHDRVVTTRNEIINQSTIYLGVCSRPYFHRVVTECPHILSYILCRPPEYEAVMRGLLNLSTRKIRDVLNLPLKKADGSVQDPKIIELVLKAAAMVDLRAKGGYVQRSETKNLNLVKQETTSYTTVFQAASSDKAFDVTKIAEDIDHKIAALEKEMSSVAGQSLPSPDQMQAPIENPPVLEATYTKVEKEQF